MKIYIKEILDEILAKYNNMVLKGFYDIENYKIVKYDIRLTDKKLIKHK